MPPEKVKKCLSRMRGKLSRTVLRRGKGSNPFSLVDYTSMAFTSFCEGKKMQQSMSKAGCPYDNAPMESFFGKLKNEHIKHYSIKDNLHLEELINDYIFRYYHHKRPHSFLGGLTPFEKRYSK